VSETGNLRTVERKVLGALLILADDNMIVDADTITIAHTMGYKSTGGAITFAMQALEMKNYITVENNKFKVLI